MEDQARTVQKWRRLPAAPVDFRSSQRTRSMVIGRDYGGPEGQEAIVCFSRMPDGSLKLEWIDVRKTGRKVC